jgi:hypothetical protein
MPNNCGLLYCVEDFCALIGQEEGRATTEGYKEDEYGSHARGLECCLSPRLQVSLQIQDLRVPSF